MTVNADIKRNKSENSITLLRRFSRQIKGTGILRKVRSKRYHARKDSSYKEKMSALRRLEKQGEYDLKEKMGLLMNVDNRRRRR